MHSDLGLRIGKHPLEGSCQEAILPPSTTFDHVFPLRSVWYTPPLTCGRRRIPVFFRVVSAVWTPHQTPIRIKARGRLAATPDVGPWHLSCPRKPSVPCRVQSYTAPGNDAAGSTCSKRAW